MGSAIDGCAVLVTGASSGIGIAISRAGRPGDRHRARVAAQRPQPAILRRIVAGLVGKIARRKELGSA